MKDVLVAFGASLAVVILFIFGVADYVEVRALMRSGDYGEMVVGSLAGERRRSRSTVYLYDADLAGVPIRISSTDQMEPGLRMPVLFDPAALRGYGRDRPEPFTQYRTARRSDSAWWIMRETFSGLLLLGMMFAGLAWFSWQKVREEDRKGADASGTRRTGELEP